MNFTKDLYFPFLFSFFVFVFTPHFIYQAILSISLPPRLSGNSRYDNVSRFLFGFCTPKWIENCGDIQFLFFRFLMSKFGQIHLYVTSFFIQILYRCVGLPSLLMPQVTYPVIIFSSKGIPEIFFADTAPATIKNVK